MDPLANEPLLKHWRDATCGGASDKITVTKGEVWKLIDRAADAVTAELQIVRLTAAADALRSERDALLRSLASSPPEAPASGTADAWVIECAETRTDDALFWGPNRHGYTTDLNAAGRYTEAEAKAQAASRPIDRAHRLSGARLTEAQVSEIRRLNSIGVAKKVLARQYQVDPSAIRQLIRRRTWRHVA